MVQFAPAATLPPQVEVMPNCPAAFIEEIVRLLLARVGKGDCLRRLAVPTACLLKTRCGVVGEKATTPVLSSTKKSL